MSASKRNIKSCLDGIGLSDAKILEACNNLTEEFAIIKKSYFKTCLRVHPDKGGSDEEFRNVNDCFESLRQIFEKGRIKSFYSSSGESASDEFNSSRSRSGNFTARSWDFYEEAAGESIPLYNVERAKSARSTCAQTTKLARKCPAKDSKDPASLIAKDELRVGTMDMMSGSYSRFSHIQCWRVASRVWLGLPDPDTCQDRAKFDEALMRMNSVTLTGYSDLSDEEKDLIIDHVMDKSHWAKLRKSKAQTDEVPLAIKLEQQDTPILNSQQPQLSSKPSQQASGSGSIMAAGGSVAKREPLVETSIAFAKPPTNQIAVARPRFEMPLVTSENRHFLSGQTVVLTGIFPEVGGGAGLSQGKDRVRAMVESFGGRVTSAISGKTDLLIVGKEPGFSKVSKARTQPKCRLLSLQDLSLAIGSNNQDAIENPLPLTIDATAFSSGYYGTSSLALQASTEQLEIAQGLRDAPLLIKKPRGMQSEGGNGVGLFKKKAAKATKKRPAPRKKETSSEVEASEDSEEASESEEEEKQVCKKAKTEVAIVDLAGAGVRRSGRRRIATVPYGES